MFNFNIANMTLKAY